MPIPSLSRCLNARLLAVLVGVAAIVPMGAAQAQDAYPRKPIRLVVPFPPGGGTDMIARTVAQRLADHNKWTVVVDNRPGAGGNLGVDAVAKAAPDGQGRAGRPYPGHGPDQQPGHQSLAVRQPAL